MTKCNNHGYCPSFTTGGCTASHPCVWKDGDTMSYSIPAPALRTAVDRGACPYCGGNKCRSISVAIKYERDTWWRVKCDTCGSYGPMGKTKQDAINLFTNRAALAAAPAPEPTDDEIDRAVLVYMNTATGLENSITRADLTIFAKWLLSRLHGKAAAPAPDESPEELVAKFYNQDWHTDRTMFERRTEHQTLIAFAKWLHSK